MKVLTALAVILLANPAAALPQAQNQDARQVHRGTNTHIFKHADVREEGIRLVPVQTRMRMAHTNCAVDHCYRVQVNRGQFNWTRTDNLKAF